MIKERHVQKNLFETLVLPAAMVMDPELEAIDALLDEDPSLLEEVKAALAQRRPHSKRLGRPSSPVEVVFRMLLLKHLYGWSYEETERNVRDSLVLRRFCRVYFERVPDDTVLIRWACYLPDHVLKGIHQKIVQLARKRWVTTGRKLRVDTTVVETDIHYPTDSRLLLDGVRVLARICRKVRHAGLATGKLVRQFTRSARDKAYRIGKYARTGEDATREPFQKAYKELIDITPPSGEQC